MQTDTLCDNSTSPPTNNDPLTFPPGFIQELFLQLDKDTVDELIFSLLGETPSDAPTFQKPQGARKDKRGGSQVHISKIHEPIDLPLLQTMVLHNIENSDCIQQSTLIPLLNAHKLPNLTRLYLTFNSSSPPLPFHTSTSGKKKKKSRSVDPLPWFDGNLGAILVKMPKLTQVTIHHQYCIDLFDKTSKPIHLPNLTSLILLSSSASSITSYSLAALCHFSSFPQLNELIFPDKTYFEPIPHWMRTNREYIMDESRQKLMVLLFKWYETMPLINDPLTNEMVINSMNFTELLEVSPSLIPRITSLSLFPPSRFDNNCQRYRFNFYNLFENYDLVGLKKLSFYIWHTDEECEYIRALKAIILKQSTNLTELKIPTLSLNDDMCHLIINTPLALTNLTTFEFRISRGMTRMGLKGLLHSDKMSKVSRLRISLQYPTSEETSESSTPTHLSGDDIIQLITTSPYLTQLKEFHLDNFDVTPLSFRYIADSTTVTTLTDISPLISSITSRMSNNFDDLIYLLQSPNISYLTEFPFKIETPSLELLKAFCNANLCYVHHVSLANTKTEGTTQWMTAFFENPAWKNLRNLDLSDCNLSDDDIKSLANSPYINNIRCLNLAKNNITDEGLKILFQSPFLGNLQNLQLQKMNTEITDASISTLPQSPSISTLFNLDLGGNLCLTAEGSIVPLAHAPWLFFPNSEAAVRVSPSILPPNPNTVRQRGGFPRAVLQEFYSSEYLYGTTFTSVLPFKLFKM